MLDSLLMGQTARAVLEALAAAGSAPVAVVGNPRLGRVLAARGREIVQVVEKQGRTREGERRVTGQLGSLPLADGELAAVVGVGVGQHGEWAAVMAEWTRVVSDRGILVLVDRGPPMELTSRALCGGLTEIEQRRAGRYVVTSGQVIKL